MPESASASLHTTAIGLGQVPYRSMISLARAIKEVAQGQAIAATGDGRLSNAGRGARLRARDKIEGRQSVVRLRVTGVPTGPWVWITDGTDPHVIAPRRRGRRRGSGRLAIGDGFVSGAVRHPGSPGKRAWNRVRDNAERIAPETVLLNVRRVLNG